MLNNIIVWNRFKLSVVATAFTDLEASAPSFYRVMKEERDLTYIPLGPAFVYLFAIGYVTTEQKHTDQAEEILKKSI